MGKIATWDYIQTLTESSLGVNPNECPAYGYIMSRGIEGLTVSRTHPNTQLVEESELSYSALAPELRWFIMVTYTLPQDFSYVQVAAVSSAQATGPVGGAYTYIGSYGGGIHENTTRGQHTVIVQGVYGGEEYGFRNPQTTVQLDNGADALGDFVSVNGGSCYINLTYGQGFPMQIFTVPGTLSQVQMEVSQAELLI
jgi:hypothetical protein